MSVKSQPGRGFIAALTISLVGSIIMMAVRFYIMENVVENTFFAVILASLIIALCTFFAASMAKKHYVGRAFNKTAEFWRKFLFTVLTAMAFAIGMTFMLGAFMANNAPVFVEIAGKSYTDNDVLTRYVIAWLFIYITMGIISVVLIKTS